MERLTEKCSVSLKNEGVSRIPLTEKTITESNDGKQYESLGAYTVEISRYNFLNRNGRVYSKGLWENVINNQVGLYEGSAGLMNHPSSEPSVKDIFCVWHNLRLREENQTVIADMYLVGEYGRQAKEFLEAGGKLELSSSGFGNILEDGKTVEESTYQIERPADWVFDASNEVFATNEDKIGESFKKTSTNIIVEENKDSSQLNEREFFTMNEKQQKMFIEKYLRDEFKSADKAESLTEKKKIYEGILEYLDGETGFSAFVEKAKKGLKDVEVSVSTLEETASKLPKIEKEKLKEAEKLKKIEKKCAHASKFAEAMRDKIKDLKEALGEAEKKNEVLTELYRKTQAEKNSMVSADEYLKAYSEKKKSTMERSMKPVRKFEGRKPSTRRKPVISRESMEEREERRERIKKIIERRKRMKEREERSERKPVSRRREIERKPFRRFEKTERFNRFEESPKVDSLKEKQTKLLQALGFSSYVSEADQILEWYKDIEKMNRSNKNISETLEKNQDYILGSITLKQAKERFSMVSNFAGKEKVSESGSFDSFAQKKDRIYEAEAKSESGMIKPADGLSLAVQRMQEKVKDFK